MNSKKIQLISGVALIIAALWFGYYLITTTDAYYLEVLTIFLSTDTACTITHYMELLGALVGVLIGIALIIDAVKNHKTEK